MGRTHTKITSDDSSSRVTTSSNATGTFDTVLAYEVGQSENIVLADGKALRTELRQSGNTELPDDAEILVAWRPPNSNTHRDVGSPKKNRTYNNLTLADQRNSDYHSQVAYEVPQGELRLKPSFTLEVRVNASAAVDFSAADTYIEIEVIREDRQSSGPQ